jgi:hypothetical protein
MRKSQNDLEELQRLANNFNAKIYRTRKKIKENPGMYESMGISDAMYLESYLPKTIKKKDVQQLFDMVYSRNQFNFVKKSFSDFSVKGAEEPLPVGKNYNKLTNWERGENLRRQQSERMKDRYAKEDLAKKPVKSRGKPVGYTMGESGLTDLPEKPKGYDPVNLRPATYEKKKKLHEMRLFEEFYQSQRMEVYKANYLATLQANNYPEDIIQMVENIPNEMFYETVKTDMEGDLSFIYLETKQGKTRSDEQEREMNAKVESLRAVWQTATQKAIQMGLM